jgi:hypothetical protein
LGAPRHDNGNEHKIVDWNLNHKLDSIIGPLETLNANDFAEDYIPLVKKEITYVVSDPPHDKHESDCFIYSSMDSQENVCAN